ncbi:MAG: YlmC/YmxH family sporulation protein [Clostridia bacterium]|nr:YlmC/YmxH family sporulation protein [Clostridia bacterium]
MESSARLQDLRLREVINVHDGTRYGFVSDAIVDLKTGKITSIVIPGSARLMGFLGRKEDVVIPWEAIRKIGDDIVLVDYQPMIPLKNDGK